jgi:uncharacterized protein (TIGR04255 family)
MLKHLYPISGKHSISKVVANVLIPQVILKPKDIFENLKLNQNLKTYQKKSLLKLKRIVNFGKLNLIEDADEDSITGFIFEEFNEEGRLKNIFKIENKHEKQSVVTFETRIYEDWDNFYNRFKEDLKIFSDYLNFYIEAISLTYIDEFIWKSNDAIAVNLVFDKNSELLNKKFLDSKNGSIILFSQNQEKNLNFEERIEISFSNRIKRIVINHQYGKKMSELELFTQLSGDNSFDEKFNEAHTENKKTLKDLLSSDVQDLISLK